LAGLGFELRHSTGWITSLAPLSKLFTVDTTHGCSEKWCWGLLRRGKTYNQR
jgi:hypothetical protein